MNQDEQLLADIPDFLSISEMLKATPSEEGGKRYIYLEASNEGVDQQGERVLAKALEESAGHFLKFGNIDLDHYTIIGQRMGLTNPMAYEVGRPVDVTVRGDRTFVKAELYTGNGELAKNANMVWESMTQLNPPARWYPSVGGSVMAKSVAVDPKGGGKIGLITKVRWTNIALSRTPVNQHLPAAGTVPLATFAKSLNGLVMNKSLEAGYGSDMANLSGGSAMRMQSLDGVPQSYFEFRDEIAGAVSSREANNQTREGLVAYSTRKFNLSAQEAAEWVDRFLSDLKKHQSNRSNP
uniref:Virion structural protein n=1 Tax=Pseudomonas phage Touem01 TaxID=3138548 RepID=A0AAU6W1Y7_9VIRU